MAKKVLSDEAVSISVKAIEAEIRTRIAVSSRSGSSVPEDEIVSDVAELAPYFRALDELNALSLSTADDATSGGAKKKSRRSRSALGKSAASVLES